MPIPLLRIGLFASGHRRGLGRLVLLAGCAALGLPVVLALLVVAALAGAAGLPTAPPQGVVAPMASWVVTQPFGCTGLAFEPARGDCAHFHLGIDLAAGPGAAVMAVAPGQAEVLGPAGAGGGYGLHVLIHHAAATDTLYGHLQDIVIPAGAIVAAGTVLGHEGSTGMSTGPHLHFEVRRSGLAVDPTLVFPGIFGPDGQQR